MTVDFSTSSYQTETPRWLWHHWTKGPGELGERYADRLTRLLALDALLMCPDRLDDAEFELAVELVDEARGLELPIDEETLAQRVPQYQSPDEYPGLEADGGGSSDGI